MQRSHSRSPGFRWRVQRILTWRFRHAYVNVGWRFYHWEGCALIERDAVPAILLTWQRSTNWKKHLLLVSRTSLRFTFRHFPGLDGKTTSARVGRRWP